MVIEMFKYSTHCAREYEVERVQLELLDLGQELLRLRCQVDFKEIFFIMLILILIVIIIVIVIVAILSMYEDVNLQVEKPVGGRSTSLASLVTENEPAVLVACKMSATQVSLLPDDGVSDGDGDGDGPTCLQNEFKPCESFA